MGVSMGEAVRAKVREPVEKLTFRPEEAAESLGVSKTTIYEAIKDGWLTTFKWGRATLIRRSELEKLIDRLDPPRAA